MKNILGFLVSSPGRWIRTAAGLAMIVFGLFFANHVAGYVVAVAGLVVFALAAGDMCMFAPLCGLSAEGRRMRLQMRKPAR
jgi:hypothetical protein